MFVSPGGRDSQAQVIEILSLDMIKKVTSSLVCPLKTFIFLEARKQIMLRNRAKVVL